jgi:hypothetical protein
MQRFGFGRRWAYESLLGESRLFGVTDQRLKHLYRSAALIINLHGGTDPRPEHGESDRLVYLETDPVLLEFGILRGDEKMKRMAAAHRAFSTWGLNYGRPDCRLPMPAGIEFHRAPPPVVLDLWRFEERVAGPRFTTVANWRSTAWTPGVFRGYNEDWSKHAGFLRFVDLPERTPQQFELALGNLSEPDRTMLMDHGWRIRSASEVSDDLDTYRRYIGGSRGEFTVAQYQNVHFRTGWFSERSAAYLASGRPVITHDTGFGSYLPTGEGLFAFSAMDDVLTAVETINSEYPRHCRAARDIAREFFDAKVVLPSLLEHFGLSARRSRSLVRSRRA